MDEPRGGFGARIKAIEVVRPLTKAAIAQPVDAPVLAMLSDHSPRGEHVLFRPRPDKSERRRPERKLEQPPAQRRDVVIVALGRGLGEYVDLPVGEAELAVKLASLRIAGLGVRQIELGRTRFQNHVALRRIGDFAETLRRQYDRRVLFAQRTQPFFELGAKVLFARSTHASSITMSVGRPSSRCSIR